MQPRNRLESVVLRLCELFSLMTAKRRGRFKQLACEFDHSQSSEDSALIILFVTAILLSTPRRHVVLHVKISSHEYHPNSYLGLRLKRGVTNADKASVLA